MRVVQAIDRAPGPVASLGNLEFKAMGREVHAIAERRLGGWPDQTGAVGRKQGEAIKRGVIQRALHIVDLRQVEQGADHRLALAVE